jgi:hypothetical protein
VQRCRKKYGGRGGVELAHTDASAATLDLPPDKRAFYQGASGEVTPGRLPGPWAGVALEEGAGEPATGHVSRCLWNIAERGSRLLLTGGFLFSSPADQAMTCPNPITSTMYIETQTGDVHDVSDDPSLSGYIAVKIRSRVVATKRIPRSAFARRRRPIRLALDDDLHYSHEA